MEGFAPKGSRAGVKQMPDFITDIEGANIKLIRTHHTDSVEVRIEEIKPNGRLSNSLQI